MNNTVYAHIHKRVCMWDRESIHLHMYVCLHLKSVPDIFKKCLLCVCVCICMLVSGCRENGFLQAWLQDTQVSFVLISHCE